MKQLQKEPPKLTKDELNLAIVCVATSSAWWDMSGHIRPEDERFKELMALQRKLADIREYKRKRK